MRINAQQTDTGRGRHPSWAVGGHTSAVEGHLDLHRRLPRTSRQVMPADR
jgi:hypothetical protein